jgi:4-amino-4-deoxy-L-arabinose transferase-like glycosyltransferase
VRIVVALAPIWLIGILDRGLWTPDEPREADIAWRMTQQSDRTLPELAGTPFLEKPPLSYGMSSKHSVRRCDGARSRSAGSGDV